MIVPAVKVVKLNVMMLENLNLKNLSKVINPNSKSIG